MHGDHGTLLPALYEIESAHWWNAGKRQVTRTLLSDIQIPPGPILEIGCGGGTVLAEVARHHPSQPVLDVDLQPVAVALARERVGEGAMIVQASLHLNLPAGLSIYALARRGPRDG
jgi:tRNA G46 methylase TrmB